MGVQRATDPSKPGSRARTAWGVGLALYLLGSASTGIAASHRLQHQEEVAEAERSNRGYADAPPTANNEQSSGEIPDLADCKPKPQGESGGPQWTDKLTARATSLLVLVSVVQAGLFVWQLRLLQTSTGDAAKSAIAAENATNAATVWNELSRSAHLAEQRPWIYVKSASLLISENKIDFFVTNIGRSASSSTHVEYEITSGDWQLPLEDIFEKDVPENVFAVIPSAVVPFKKSLEGRNDIAGQHLVGKVVYSWGKETFRTGFVAPLVRNEDGTVIPEYVFSVGPT